ncbi:inositol monophosphatase [Vibrio tritonius]|uniref:Inositol-1-monophosphatase n=1 Tax=Vibrio tritonius TaxID=1435069 RepID=A0ABS7YQP9_9VIBR|nr:inositol monophosphatase family protein [Vibrio tritonius]MCA2016774.1 inositol monophosphatase [Vibrio tritonius]
MNQALELREAALKTHIVKAGLLALSHFHQRSPEEFTLKGKQDFLTEADGLVEHYLNDVIHQQFPLDGIFGEETGGFDEQCEYLWVIDPIDGTANYARGIGHFCVSIALVSEGQTELGAIYNPVTEELYIARKGQYACKNQRPLHVSQTHSLDSTSFELGWSKRVPQSRYLDVVKNLLDLGANIRRGASGALALAWVAEGRTDGYAELHMNAWDCLAGLLLVREAGGYTGSYPEDYAAIKQGGAIFAATPDVAVALSQAVEIPIQFN